MEPIASRRTRLIVGLLGFVLLFGPWVAFATGARSTPIVSENRALAQRPEWRGFATLREITDFAADRFPLRDDAVRANKRLGNVAASGSGAGAAGVGAKPSGTEALITTPTLAGRDGWLFLPEDFNRACHPELTLGEVGTGLKRLHDILTRSGRRFVVSIVPDKSSFETQFLPKRYPLETCSEKTRAPRRKTLAALRLPSLVDMLPILKADERATNTLAYLPTDSHWTDRSSALFVKAMAERLDPALAEGTELRFSEVGLNHHDLALLNGDNTLKKDPVWKIVRGGVTATVERKNLAPGNAYETRTVTATTTGPAKLFEPKTVWIGDSFSDRAVEHFSQYFADLVEVPDLVKATLSGKTTDGQDLAALMLPRILKLIKQSEAVVIQAVERYFFANRSGSLVTDEFLDRLEAELT